MMRQVMCVNNSKVFISFATFDQSEPLWDRMYFMYFNIFDILHRQFEYFRMEYPCILQSNIVILWIYDIYYDMNILYTYYTRITRSVPLLLVARSSVTLVLTRLPLHKMAAISQTVFSDAFWWIKCLFWLHFQWTLFPSVQLKIKQHLFR